MWLKRGLQNAILSFARILSQNFQVTGPFSVSLALIQIKGFALTGSRDKGGRARFDRDDLLFQLRIEEVPATEEQLMVELRPIFDSLWQAAGSDSCPYYLESGHWDERQS